MKKTFLATLATSSLIGAALLALAGLTQIYASRITSRLQGGPLQLQIPPVRQLTGTSCGEAVIVMAYNYKHPEAPLIEPAVIEYATGQGYFTEGVPPFTSPANMSRIAAHYSPGYSSGNVLTAGLGLELLAQSLQRDEPVIIDVLSNLADPESEAHFVLVTGLSADPNRDNPILVTYNDPFTGQTLTGDWVGDNGIWRAWQRNPDPGGSGWWMVIH
jgi:hypothetical protein